VLNAMGVLLARARASLRFSLSRLNTEADVDAALEIVPTAVAHLRELSPVYKRHLAETAVR
jgi:cysteine desulfurase